MASQAPPKPVAISMAADATPAASGPPPGQASAPLTPGMPGGIPAPGPPSGGSAIGAQPGGGPGIKGPPDPKKINPYLYQPSFTMAIAGSVVYLFTGFVHTYQLFKYKTWYLNLLPQAALMSAAAMIARTHSIVTLKQTGATGPFIIYMFLDMIAPALVLFANIFTFTRVMWWVTPNDKRNTATLWGPPKAMSLTWGFCAMIPDVVKTVGQRAFKPTDPMGTHVQSIAQVVQILVVALFFVVTLRFMVMSKKWMIHAEAEEKNWRMLGWTVCAASGLLAFHHLFGQVAFDARMDPKSFYMGHEWIYWVTQEIPLFAVYALYIAHYPGQYLPFSYCRFKFDVKKVEKEKLESTWPMQISNPIHNEPEYAARRDEFVHQDDKAIEITMSDLETGRKTYGK